MESVVYLNLSNKSLSETLTGNSFSFPKLSYGEQITLRTRLSQRQGSANVEVERTVNEMRASIGRVDARPESGSYQFEVGTGNIIAAIDHNASATQMEDVINALASAEMTALGAATVELKNGSYFIRFANETVAAYPTVTDIAAATSNSLSPISFVRHRAFVNNLAWVHEIRLIQAPVSSTDQTRVVLPDPPTITSIDDGGTSGDITWNEIQALNMPTDFRGTYRIRRGLQRTALLSRADGIEQIAEALEDLIDDGGEFIVTNPTDRIAHIEFAGDMGGIDQDLMTIEVFDSPAGDRVITLDLDTPELAHLLRESDEVKLPIEIEADIEDTDDDSIEFTRKLYVGEVTIRRELHWEELSTAANIDWLRPPLPEAYGGFDYSQIAVGNASHSDAYGDGIDTAFVIDHNLDATDVTVIVKDASSGDLLVLGTDYSVVVTNSNSLTVTSLVGAPTTNDWRITVLGLDETSAFDPHTHPISDITGLQTSLDNLGDRLADIETLSGGNPITTDDSDSSRIAEWILPSMFEVYPARETVEEMAINSLKDSDLPRARGLLPAVHDSVVANLSTIRTGDTLEAASDHTGNVFLNDGTEFKLAVGQGHRPATISAGDHIASDGRVWYEVTRYGYDAFTNAFDWTAEDILETDTLSHNFDPGEIVQFTTTGTLPVGISTGTDYYIIETPSDTEFSVSATKGGTSIQFTDAGSGVHTVLKPIPNSFYPSAFERELFKIHVNEKQLRLRRTLELSFALEVGVLKSNADAMWTLVVEKGEYTSATTPDPVGRNLSDIEWDIEQPWVDQPIILTPTATTHRFGVRVTRTLVSAVDTLTPKARIYGALEGGLTVPSSANFAIRARLIRFDTDDGESDPKGMVVLRGLGLTGGAQDEPGDEGGGVTEGTAIIT